MIENQKSEVFWEIIDVLRQSSLLPHIMIIGSWAEYLYPYCLGKDYLPNLKTRDVDVYFGNPYLEVDGAESLIENFQDAGFLLDEHFVDTGKFFKNGIEVEFLSSQVGSGPGVIEIPFTGVKAEKLCDLNMLKPIWVEVRGYEIKIPSPVSYALHKLYINPERNPSSKRLKDIEAVRSLLYFLERKPEEVKNLKAYIQTLSDEKRQKIFQVAETNGLEIPTML